MKKVHLYPYKRQKLIYNNSSIDKKEIVTFYLVNNGGS
jgi:hypothetical protein